MLCIPLHQESFPAIESKPSHENKNLGNEASSFQLLKAGRDFRAVSAVIMKCLEAAGADQFPSAVACRA